MPRTIKIEVNNAVFSLPYHVAQERGLFRDEGLNVELIPAGSGRDRDKEVPEKPIEDHRAVKSYGWHEGIEAGEYAMYRACEWGQIRRTQDSRQGARVISKRAAVATQAIVVRGDSPCHVPADLHHVLVGVNMHAGSHYVTLALLEGYLKRDEIRPGHVGGPKQRLRFLEDGRIGAAALMEPWITVAVKRGHKIICEAFYEGAEVGVPSLDPEGYAGVDRAIRRAVDSINESITPYLKYLIREVPKEIAELNAKDFYLGRFRYVYPRAYTPEEYDRIYEWMVGWGLLSPESRFETIVDGRLSACGAQPVPRDRAANQA
ncbi:MAG: ABC transporter substrate-binding protein [Acidobacteria bacterium]|nr:ABC transporter substrate-binding protein [Acidobacteriota bacterium]